MCRAHSSLRRPPVRVSIEAKQALRNSVDLTMSRRTLLAQSVEPARPMALTSSQQPALGMGTVDPIFSQLHQDQVKVRR